MGNKGATSIDVRETANQSSKRSGGAGGVFTRSTGSAKVACRTSYDSTTNSFATETVLTRNKHSSRSLSSFDGIGSEEEEVEEVEVPNITTGAARGHLVVEAAGAGGGGSGRRIRIVTMYGVVINI
jgi:hypothetical protein